MSFAEHVHPHGPLVELKALGPPQVLIVPNRMHRSAGLRAIAVGHGHAVLTDPAGQLHANADRVV